MRARALLALAVVCLLAVAPAAHGNAGIDLPVNAALQTIVNALSGRLAVLLGTLALIAAAFTWMFLRHERGADFAVRALLGAALAIGAATLVGAVVGTGAVL